MNDCFSYNSQKKDCIYFDYVECEGKGKCPFYKSHKDYCEILRTCIDVNSRYFPEQYNLFLTAFKRYKNYIDKIG